MHPVTRRRFLSFVPPALALAVAPSLALAPVRSALAQGGGNAVDLMQFGGHGDGITPDTDAFEKAFAFLGDHPDAFLLLNGAYVTDRPLVVPSGARLTGAGHIRILDGAWTLKSGVSLQNLSFSNDKTGWMPVLKTDYKADAVQVTGCTIRGGVPLWLNVCQNSTISNNTFLSQRGYPVFCDGMSDSTVSDNLCQTIGGYGMQLSGRLERNVISNNRVEGDGKTLTGIIILSKLQDRVRDNRITGNTVSNVAEEGISIDYNTPTLLTQTAADYNAATAILSVENLDADAAAGRSLFVLDGPEKGGYATIKTAHANGMAVLEDATFQSLAAGTRIAVAWAPMHTRITDNHVTRAGRTGIMLYGSQIDTLVEGNTVGQCGFGRTPSWQGRTPYACAGISALTISQNPNRSLVHACRITRNAIDGCDVGISAGIALWDGPPSPRPAGLIITDNSVTHCGRPIKLESMLATDLSLDKNG